MSTVWWFLDYGLLWFVALILFKVIFCYLILFDFLEVVSSPREVCVLIFAQAMSFMWVL